MKKIAICTIESNNYGNRLQNYALQTIFQEYGFEVETIHRQPYPLQKYIKDMLRSYIVKDRFTCFFQFNKLIRWSREYLDMMHIPKELEDKYDAFFIGSDQIWNPTFPFSSRNDYLYFIKKKPKFAIAASFGLDQMPSNENLKKDLLEMAEISVRENAGAKIVYNLTGRLAEVLIDPTLMFNNSFWMKLEKKPHDIDLTQVYCLTYFLGEISEEKRLLLKNIAQKTQVTLYELDIHLDNGPSEFLWLVHHAKYVLTDSFHATVFSVLFSRPFVTFPREGKDDNMISRLETLLKTLKLERKLFCGEISNEQITECDYQESFSCLEKERGRFLTFLQHCIEEI